MTYLLETLLWAVIFGVVYTSLQALLRYLRGLKYRNAKRLSVNAGVTLKLTENEVAEIFEGGEWKDVITSVLHDGRFEWNGRVHVSEAAIERFNNRYSTNYSCNSINEDLESDT